MGSGTKESKAEVVVKATHVDYQTCKEGDLVWAVRSGGFGAGKLVGEIPYTTDNKRTAQMLVRVDFGTDINPNREFKYVFECYLRNPSLNGADKPTRTWGR